MSSFVLSPEHAELRVALRRFAEAGIAPHAAGADADGEYPRASFDAYRDSGFIRLPYPEQYGGDGGLVSAMLFYLVTMVQAGNEQPRLSGYINNVTIPKGYFGK